jgi:hypothetical protein
MPLQTLGFWDPPHLVPGRHHRDWDWDWWIIWGPYLLTACEACERRCGFSISVYRRPSGRLFLCLCWGEACPGADPPALASHHIGIIPHLEGVSLPLPIQPLQISTCTSTVASILISNLINRDLRSKLFPYSSQSVMK